VEDEVVAGGVAEAGGDRLLAFAEDGGTQLDGPRLVHAVDVAEDGGEEVAPLLAATEDLGRPHHVGGRRVELGPVDPLVVHRVLHPPDDPDLQLEDDVERGALGEELGGEGEVLLEWQRRRVEHVALEERPRTGRPPGPGEGEERADVRVDLLRLAVVGVEGDVDGVPPGDDVGELGEGGGSRGHVLHPLPGEELRPPGRDLDDAVRSRLGETGEGGVECLRRRDVDGGVRVSPPPGGVEHLAVLVGCGDRHGLSPRWIAPKLAPVPVRAGASAHRLEEPHLAPGGSGKILQAARPSVDEAEDVGAQAPRLVEEVGAEPRVAGEEAVDDLPDGRPRHVETRLRADDGSEQAGEDDDRHPLSPARRR